MLEFIRNVPFLAFFAICFYCVLVACINGKVRSRVTSLLDHPRPSSSGKTVLALDSIRGIAILMVVTFHLFQWFNTGFGTLGKIALIRNGWCGVEIFVALSGYLIYGAVISGGALTKYC